jgi:hypothetical protein
LFRHSLADSTRGGKIGGWLRLWNHCHWRCYWHCHWCCHWLVIGVVLQVPSRCCLITGAGQNRLSAAHEAGPGMGLCRKGQSGADRHAGKPAVSSSPHITCQSRYLITYTVGVHVPAHPLIVDIPIAPSHTSIPGVSHCIVQHFDTLAWVGSEVRKTTPHHISLRHHNCVCVLNQTSSTTPNGLSQISSVHTHSHTCICTRLSQPKCSSSTTSSIGAIGIHPPPFPTTSHQSDQAH